jgi:hypothetical protein
VRELHVRSGASRAALHDAIGRECERHPGAADHAAAVSFVVEHLLADGGTRSRVDALVVVSAHDDATMLMVRYRSARSTALQDHQRDVLDQYCSQWSTATSNGCRTIHAQVPREDVGVRVPIGR